MLHKGHKIWTQRDATTCPSDLLFGTVAPPCSRSRSRNEFATMCGSSGGGGLQRLFNWSLRATVRAHCERRERLKIQHRKAQPTHTTTSADCVCVCVFFCFSSFFDFCWRRREQRRPADDDDDDNDVYIYMHDRDGVHPWIVYVVQCWACACVRVSAANTPQRMPPPQILLQLFPIATFRPTH